MVLAAYLLIALLTTWKHLAIIASTPHPQMSQPPASLSLLNLVKGWHWRTGGSGWMTYNSGFTNGLVLLQVDDVASLNASFLNYKIRSMEIVGLQISFSPSTVCPPLFLCLSWIYLLEVSRMTGHRKSQCSLKHLWQKYRL